jgi:hypothetical protein
VLGNVGRRAVESVIGLFALLGFAYVPLGSKTGLEHSLALMRTAPAQEALAGLIGAVARARAKLVDALFPAPLDTKPLPLPGAGLHGRAVKPLLPRILEAPQRDTTR